MRLSEYQDDSSQTAIYPGALTGVRPAMNYAVLGLVGEAGELANKVKKIYRDDIDETSDEFREAVKQELGDVLWYVARVADEFGLELDDVAESNLSKLFARQEAGTLGGSGDSR